MGLYISNKEKFLALCEEFFDNGKDYVVVGFDNEDNLRIDLSTNASEASLGYLLYGACYNKLFGCGMDYYERLKTHEL